MCRVLELVWYFPGTWLPLMSLYKKRS